jgi:TonB family protein
VKARIISIPASSFVYPKQLIAVGAEGNTVLLLTVSKTGNLEKVELSESSGFEALDSAAIKGVKLCKFSPSTKNGEKVESKIIWKYIWRVPVGQ